MANYFIIPKTVCSYDDEDDIENEYLDLSTAYIHENKIPIRHGDLARLECVCSIIRNKSSNNTINIDTSIIKDPTKFMDNFYKKHFSKFKRSNVRGRKFGRKSRYNSEICTFTLHDDVASKPADILVLAESAQTWNSYGKYGGYYRNQGLMIWDEDKFVDIDNKLDDYGYVPDNFVLFEEPHYFEKYHWHDTERRTEEDIRLNGRITKSLKYYNSPSLQSYIVHNTFLWIRAVPEMLKNINELENDIYYTYWHDCRGKKRYIFTHEESSFERFERCLTGVISVNFDDEETYDRYGSFADRDSVLFVDI